MFALVVVVAYVACAEPAHDPAGDPPPQLVTPAQPPVVVLDAVAREQAIVVELVPVGVPDETGRLATTLLVGSLRARLTTHDVRGPETLDAATKKAAAACSARACFDAVATGAKVDDVVHGTVQKIGNGVLVTLDLGAAHAVSQVDDAAQLSTAVDTAVDALIAQRRAPLKPAATKPAPASLGRSSATAPATPPATGAPNDDLVMLAIDYALFFLPFAGSPFLLPLSQGLLHGFGGKQIVHNDYPQWFLGTLAGYGVYVVGGLLFVGMYVFAISSGGSAIGTLLGVGSLGVLALTLVAESAVVWWVARQGAVSVGDGVGSASDKALLRGSPLASIPDGAVVDDVAVNLFD